MGCSRQMGVIICPTCSLLRSTSSGAPKRPGTLGRLPGGHEWHGCKYRTDGGGGAGRHREKLSPAWVYLWLLMIGNRTDFTHLSLTLTISSRAR